MLHDTDPFLSNEHLGVRLIELRLFFELNLPAMAEFIEINKGSLYKWETGMFLPSLPNLQKVLIAFNLTHEVFFSSKAFIDILSYQHIIDIKNSTSYQSALLNNINKRDNGRGRYKTFT